MANAYLKQCSNALLISEKQKKKKKKLHCDYINAHSRFTKMWKPENFKWRAYHGAIRVLMCTWWECKLVNLLWRGSWQYLVKICTHTSCIYEILIQRGMRRNIRCNIVWKSKTKQNKAGCNLNVHQEQNSWLSCGYMEDTIYWWKEKKQSYINQCE